MSGKSQKVDLAAVSRSNIDWSVWCRLCGVDKNLRSNGVGLSGDFVNRVDRAQHVGHRCHGNEFGLRREILIELRKVEPQVIGEWQPAECRSTFLANHLPGNDVGVMLHVGDENFVARVQKLCSPRASDNVDGHRRAGCKRDLAA